MGIYSASERQRHLETGSYEFLAEETGSAAELLEDAPQKPVVEVVDVSTVAEEAGHGRLEAPVVEVVEPQKARTSAELLEQLTGTAVDSPLCMTCGTKMRPAGSCYVCEGCGSTSGCS